MSGVHRIRLQAAWQPPTHGAAGWIRSFGRPAGLEPGDRVWLVIERPAACTAEFNGVVVPPVTADPGGAWRHEITRLLADRNELRLVPETGMPDGAALPTAHGRRPLPDGFGAVAIEIEPR